MKNNMGSVDRILRGIAGVVVIAVGFYYQSWWGAFGLIFLLTALVSWCPLYIPFKISTKKARQS
ncbi:MAG: DUF2892 domain-containing protein [bacterium]|nr:MAG: DUF2892 domain-containing protein [bacterium]